MLPVIRLSDSPDLDSHLAFKRREAKWKRLVSETHKEWCLCGSYLNHFLPATSDLLSCTGGEDGPGAGSEEAKRDEDFLAGGGDIEGGQPLREDW